MFFYIITKFVNRYDQSDIYGHTVSKVFTDKDVAFKYAEELALSKIRCFTDDTVRQTDYGYDLFNDDVVCMRFSVCTVSPVTRG